jgi:hypothetical protein
MNVVPVIVHRDMLEPHIRFIGFGRSIEGRLRPGILAEAIVDMAGHVNHVA